jgi:hypothetical protein
MEDEGLKDAVQAFFEAGKAGDFDEAAQAYKDMCRLNKEGGEEEGYEEGEGKSEDSGGKPLSVMIGLMGKKK